MPRTAGSAALRDPQPLLVVYVVGQIVPGTPAAQIANPCRTAANQFSLNNNAAPNQSYILLDSVFYSTD